MMGSAVAIPKGSVCLQLQKYPKHTWFVVHDGLVKISCDNPGTPFKIVPGLIKRDGAVSFEVANRPGWYLCHYQRRMYIHEPWRAHESMFNWHASFMPRAALSGAGDYTSYESASNNGLYICHRNYILMIAKSDESRLHRHDASFRSVEPSPRAAKPIKAISPRVLWDDDRDIARLWGRLMLRSEQQLSRVDASRRGEAIYQLFAFLSEYPGLKKFIGIGLLKYRFYGASSPNLCLRSQNHSKHTWFVLTDEDVRLAEGSATHFRIVPGLTGAAGSVSFEDASRPGYFLRHCNWLLRCHKPNGSDLFRWDATFSPRAALSGSRKHRSFESTNYPNHFICHRNYALRIDTLKETEASHREDASFLIEIVKS